LIQNIQKGGKLEGINLGETNTFFGLLNEESLEEKKKKVLQIYLLIFRFSIEKLSDYLKNDMFIMVLYQYIQSTQLRRIHER
jgi:hypothetical protein